MAIRLKPRRRGKGRCVDRPLKARAARRLALTLFLVSATPGHHSSINERDFIVTISPPSTRFSFSQHGSDPITLHPKTETHRSHYIAFIAFNRFFLYPHHSNVSVV